MHVPARVVGPVAAVVTVLIWSSFIVIARQSAQHDLTALDMALARIVGASLVLLPLGWWLARRKPATASFGGLSPLPARTTVLVGFFGGLLYALLAYAGFFYAPATHAAVLMPGSLPLWTALLAAVVLREHLSPARLTGLALIVFGDLMVGGVSLLQAFDGGQVWRGDLLFMTAACCWATYSVLARKFALDPVRATVAITVFAFLAYVPAYLVAVATGLVNSGLGEVPAREWIFQAAFQGVGSVVVAGMTFTQMIRHYGPVRSTMITALVPALSALGAVWLLDEPLHWNLLLGLGLVTLGIVAGVGGWRRGASGR